MCITKSHKCRILNIGIIRILFWYLIIEKLNKLTSFFCTKIPREHKKNFRQKNKDDMKNGQDTQNIIDTSWTRENDFKQF